MENFFRKLKLKNYQNEKINCENRRRNKFFNKTLQENAITLVALVVTIIVLLVLAGVSLSIAINGGIIGKSQNATTNYKLAQVDESNKLSNTEAQMDSYISGTREINENFGKTYTLKANKICSGTAWFNNIATFNLPEGYYLIKSYCGMNGGPGNLILTCFDTSFESSYSQSENYYQSETQYCIVTSSNQSLSVYTHNISNTGSNGEISFECFRLK